VHERDVHRRIAYCQNDVICAHGSNRAGSGSSVDGGDPHDLVPVFGVEQAIADRAAPSQRYGGSFLLGLEHFGELEAETAGNFDEIGVSERIHRDL
jgi:hypothetical protein